MFIKQVYGVMFMSQMTSSFSIPTKILLPTDFSPSSISALDAATDLAKHYKSKLHLVHIIPTIPDFNGADFFPETSVLEERRDEIDQRLRECQASMLAQGADVSYTIETGNDVVGNIMRVIKRDGIDMVVISTHGMSGWRPVVFGSITEKVIKLVQCPLLLLQTPKPVEGSKESCLAVWDETFCAP
jgi:nucleotide-binding universal stress UspA family protein